MTQETKPGYGQVLVVVAIALLALLAFVALAVDVGGIYQERRAMQNAADAGALAGAREMCFGSEANAESVAHDYTVNRNGAAGALITVTAPTTVTVVATQTYKTYFAGLLGFDEIPVDADATAVCGKSLAVGDLWPVGFDMDRWLNYKDKMGCWDVVIIWEDLGQQVACSGPDGDGMNCCQVFDAKKNGTLITDVPGCNMTGGDYEPFMYPLDRANMDRLHRWPLRLRSLPTCAQRRHWQQRDNLPTPRIQQQGRAVHAVPQHP